MPITDNLEAFWPLATNSNDATGNGHNGTDTSVSYGPGYATLTSGPSYITFTNTDFGSDFSLSAIVYLASTPGSYGTILADNSGFGFDGFYIGSDSKIHFRCDSFGYDLQSVSTIPGTTEKHIVFTFVHSTKAWAIYIDGVLDNFGTLASSIAGNNSFAQIGSTTSNARQLVGRLKMVGGWKDRALSAGDVSDLFALDGNPYAAPPVVISVDPTEGPVTGGTSVTINGTDFVDGATVDFDGVQATGVTFVNSTELTAVTPANPLGSSDVTVTNPDLMSDTLVGGFTYIALQPDVSGEQILPPKERFDETSGIRFANVSDGKASNVSSVNGQVRHSNRVEPISFDTSDKIEYDGRYSGVVKFRFRDYRNFPVPRKIRN